MLLEALNTCLETMLTIVPSEFVDKTKSMTANGQRCDKS